MSISYGASDIVALSSLVWKLYNDVYVPAREAPKNRLELIKELGGLKEVLSILAADTNSKTCKQRLREDRKRTLDLCLNNCGDILAKLDKLIEKHRNLRGSLWEGVKWVRTRREVAKLRSRLAVYTAHLKLFLVSTGKYVLGTTFYLE